MESIVYSLAAFSILQLLLLMYIGYKALFACEVIEKCGLTWQTIISGYGHCETERYYYNVRGKDKTSEQKLDLLLEELDFKFESESCVKREAKLVKKDAE